MKQVKDKPKKLSHEQLRRKHNAPKTAKPNRVTMTQILDLEHYKEQETDSKPFIRSSFKRGWLEPSERMHALCGKPIWKLTESGKKIAECIKAFDEELKFQRENGHGLV